MKLGVLLVSIVVLTGCAAPVTQRASISDEATKEEAARQRELAVKDMVEEQRRLTRVYRTLAIKAASICGEHVGPNIGAHLMTKPKGDLGDTLQTGYGIGERLTVLFVLPDGPAEMAGLKARDVVDSVNGVSTADPDALRTLVEKLPPDKPIAYTVNRDGQSVSITVNPDKACYYYARLDPRQIINAFTDGRQIQIARGMMSFVRDDNELAVVIAHEMAHNVMKHIDAKKQNMAVGFLADLAVAVLTRGQVSNSSFTQAGAAAYSQDFEAEADYVSLYIMRSAGIPITDAPNFWRRMAAAHPASIKTNHAASHPSSAQRMVGLTATVKEIDAKMEAGIPLLPNVKDGKFMAPTK